MQFIIQARIPDYFTRIKQKWNTFIIFVGFWQISFIFITLIKTDTLTVDTSSIIDNLSQIVYSINNLNFTACFVRSELQIRLFENAENNSLLHHLWFKDHDRCYFSYQPDSLFSLKQRKIVVFSGVYNM